jgi:hypothetical protein
MSGVPKKLQQFKFTNFGGYSYRDWFRGVSLVSTNGDLEAIKRWRERLDITNDEIEKGYKPSEIFFDQGIFVLHKNTPYNHISKKDHEELLNQFIEEIKHDKTRILLEIDLSKSKKQLLREFDLRIDEYQPFIPKVIKKRSSVIKKKELMCDPWLIWSMKEIDSLSLVAITRKLFNVKEVTSDNARYAEVRRAYQRACTILNQVSPRRKFSIKRSN